MAAYRCEIVEINLDLVDCAICELLQQVLVPVLRRARPLLVLSAAVPSLIVVIHEVILVAQVILVYGDVPHGTRYRLLGRRLELLEEALEGTWKRLAMAPRGAWASWQLTLLLLIIDGGFEFTERHLELS